MKYARLVKRLKAEARQHEAAGTEDGASRALGCLILITELRRQRGMKRGGKRA